MARELTDLDFDVFLECGEQGADWARLNRSLPANAARPAREIITEQWPSAVEITQPTASAPIG